MTTRGLRTDARERLQTLIGGEPEAIEAFLLRNADRREQIAQIVQQEEAEFADFYRELGDR